MEGKNVSYNVRFSEFETNVKTYWRHVQLERDFCDVTLACAEEQVRTHRAIISSCSPLLKDVLKQQSSDHPLIYLTGVKYKDLDHLINFMHKGVVNIAQVDLGNFLALAKDLKVSGLSEPMIKSNNVHCKISPTVAYHDSTLETLPENYQSSDFLHEINESSNAPIDLPVSTAEHMSKQKSENETCSNKIITNEKVHPSLPKTLLKTSEDVNNIFKTVEPNISNSKFKKKKIYSNNKSRKQNNTFNSPRKYEVLVGQEISHELLSQGNNSQVAEYEIKDTADNKRKGLVFPCDKCDKSYVSAFVLTRHKKSIHEGIRFPCDQCNTKPFTELKNLKQHKERDHDGVRYPCVYCDIKPFTYSRKLKEHITTSHNYYN